MALLDFLTKVKFPQKTNSSALTRFFRKASCNDADVALQLWTKPRLLNINDLENVHSDLVTINNYIDAQIFNTLQVIVGATLQSVIVKGNGTTTYNNFLGSLNNGKTIKFLYYDKVLASQPSTLGAGSYSYNNVTDTLTVNNKSVQVISAFYST